MKLEGNAKKLIWKLCRLEFIGYGLYSQLSRQAKNNPALSKRLQETANDERRHGVMFGNYYQKHYGTGYIQSCWICLGTSLGYLLYCVPMRWKVKKLAGEEKAAVQNIHHAMATRGDDRLVPLIKTILPDEVRHSQTYDDMYGS